MPEIMTTKELAKYLKLHEITICKYAAEGKIPAIRIGRVWRFDKEAIDRWISGGEKKWRMGNSEDERDLNLVLNDKTGALLMLNKEERKVIKELLVMTIYSESVRGYIEKRLGDEYIKIAEKLLESMGGA
jgi:excisionase family DNA binding protein